jgi:predicted RNA binding protein YcfA (HicA-like mRNA interferase family)
MGVDGLRSDVIFRHLQRRGYVLRSVTGSHHNFKKPGCRVVPVPVHSNPKVKLEFNELTRDSDHNIIFKETNHVMRFHKL